LFALQVTFIPWVLIIKSSKFSHSDTKMSVGLPWHLLKGNKPTEWVKMTPASVCLCMHKKDRGRKSEVQLHQSKKGWNGFMA